MSQFILKIRTMAVISATIFASLAAVALSDASFLPGQLASVRHGREFRGQKPFAVADIHAAAAHKSGPQKVVASDPVVSFNDMPRFDYLEGPDGSTWFYTAEYEFKTVVHNEMWTEDMISAFTFTIYDNQFNVVGKVSDDVEFAPNETRAREVTLDAAVSAKFFNTDDNLEVMVFYVMNTEEYVNHYYYKVYSIGGEKNAKGRDVSIATIEGSCADAVNAGTADAEDFYFTFIDNPVVDFDGPIPSAEYIEYINTIAYRLTTYTKAVDGNGPIAVMEKDIYVTRVPGDTTDGIYFISKVENGQLYLIYSQYAKPYFVEPVLLTGDESATPDNSFVIETYAVSGIVSQLVSATTIPVDYPDSSDMLRYAYYSIGSVAWANDIDMSVNGTPSAPAYIVAHDVETVSSEDVASNYEIYGNDGRLVRTIASGTESIQVMQVAGSQPQVLFVTLDDDDKYQFRFANLYDGRTLFTLSQENGGDPISAACALVRATDGSINYAFEMSKYEEDESGNTYIRVAWFKSDGTFDRIDRINLGGDVQAAMVNLDPAGLHPDVYDTDDAMEYAVLVKRSHGAATRNEFMIVDDSGKMYAKFSADDKRGDPTQIGRAHV